MWEFLIKITRSLLTYLEYRKKKSNCWSFYTFCHFSGNINKMNKALSDYHNIKKDTAMISDGYHTFEELYNFRMYYNILAFNSMHKEGKHEVYKTLKDVEGNLCSNGDWFIVMAKTDEGFISNHYKTKENWNRFDIPIKDKVVEFDGHTADNVINTMERLTRPSSNNTVCFNCGGQEYVSTDDGSTAICLDCKSAYYDN